VCASAFHSGAISTKGGDFDVSIGDGLKNYDAAKENGVESLSRKDKAGPFSAGFKGKK